MKGRASNFFQLSHRQAGLEWDAGSQLAPGLWAPPGAGRWVRETEMGPGGHGEPLPRTMGESDSRPIPQPSTIAVQGALIPSMKGVAVEL